jgi:hypothetical protein
LSTSTATHAKDDQQISPHNRRLHRIEPTLWRVLFELLARAFKERNDPEFQTYAVDSLPVPVCDNIRIRRCRIYPLEEGDDDDGIPK